MFGADRGGVDIAPRRLEGKKLYIGIVQARFNAPITNELTRACKARLIELGVPDKQIDCVQVPGALEVPTALQALAKRDYYDALVAIGCIIRGETYHFELVANESGSGVTKVALDYEIPIANAILTVENEAQALSRQTVNGQAAAQVAVEMALLINELA
jgi:6,7-dimethyl-8-ribityllumazine synthase